MPWFIVNPNGKKVEAFRSEGEARKALTDYGDGHYVTFSPSCNLQAMRMLRKMSQTELAEVSGVSIYVIQKFENGQRDINKASGEILLKLAKALNTSIEKVLEPSE